MLVLFSYCNGWTVWRAGLWLTFVVMSLTRALSNFFERRTRLAAEICKCR